MSSFPFERRGASYWKLEGDRGLGDNYQIDTVSYGPPTIQMVNIDYKFWSQSYLLIVITYLLGPQRRLIRSFLELKADVVEVERDIVNICLATFFH